LNTMIMSVVERTKEISVLRAIGWRRFNIIRMILGESVVLCALGAGVGCLIAVSFIFALTKLPQANGFIEGSVSSTVFLKGLMIATAVGVLGGAYPAYRASTLEPTEGLRHE
ncbi:MAG TPA: FtsX-like permease family protein, partial [Pirellulales bacterium]